MTSPAELPTPNDIARKLLWLSKYLDAAAAELAKADDDAVAAKAAHEKAYARAFLSCEAAAEVRKQTAVLAASAERFALDLAESKVRSIRERIRTLHAQVEITRSLSAVVRSEITLAGAS